jgi:hypothetical protein
MAQTATLIKIQGTVSNPRPEPDPMPGHGRLLVDAVFDLVFDLDGAGEQAWNCGTLTVDVFDEQAAPPISQQLDFIARSSADDVVYDMRQARYVPVGLTDEIPIHWDISAEVASRMPS